MDGKDPKWLSKWLHTLRLHKYAKNLQGLTPKELLDLREEDVIERGVDRVGARNKLILVCYRNICFSFSLADLLAGFERGENINR